MKLISATHFQPLHTPLALIIAIVTAALPLHAVAQNGQSQLSQRQEKTVNEGEIEQILVVGHNLANRTSQAGKLDIPLVETPFSVSVLTEDFFTATGVKTLQDALQYSAGVNGGTYGIDTRGDWATVRGTAPVQYIDGLKSLFGSYNNTRSAPYTLERVEILKGPSSVLYGQGSLGGVINLSSKLPEEKFAAQVWAQYGTFDRKQLAADVTGALDADGAWLYRVVALGRDSETQTDYVNDDSQVFAPSLTWAPSADTRITLLANIQEDKSGTGTQFLPWQGTILPGAFGDLDPGVFLSEPGWDKYNSKQQAYTLIASHSFTPNWSINGRARQTDSSSDYWSMWPNFTGSGLNRIAADGRTVSRTAYISDAESNALVYDINTQVEFSTGILEHKLVAGVDVQDAKTDNNSVSRANAGGKIDIYQPVYGFRPTGLVPVNNMYTKIEQQGLYVQDHVRIDKLIITAALRQDQVKSLTQHKAKPNYDTDADTGRVGLMYEFDNGIRPYASYTDSFEPLAGINNQGEALKPKTGEQTEVGLKYQPSDSNLLFTAAAYEITEQGRLVAAPTPAYPTGQAQLGEVEIKGVELELQATWDQIDVIASISTTDTEDLVTHKNLAAVPEQLASLWATYRFVDELQGLRAGVGIRDIGRSWDGTDNKAIRVNGYTLFDAMLGYEVKNWFFSVNARNLEDNLHYTSCLGRGDCYAGERRTITADVRYNF